MEYKTLSGVVIDLKNLHPHQLHITSSGAGAYLIYNYNDNNSIHLAKFSSVVDAVEEEERLLKDSWEEGHKAAVKEDPDMVLVNRERLKRLLNALYKDERCGYLSEIATKQEKSFFCPSWNDCQDCIFDSVENIDDCIEMMGERIDD